MKNQNVLQCEKNQIIKKIVLLSFCSIVMTMNVFCGFGSAYNPDEWPDLKHIEDDYCIYNTWKKLLCCAGVISCPVSGKVAGACCVTYGVFWCCERKIVQQLHKIPDASLYAYKHHPLTRKSFHSVLDAEIQRRSDIELDAEIKPISDVKHKCKEPLLFV
ncbi:hypothetical protein KAZ82_01270 [Candidatus Babeliales bacterium]|nr:hypothetical protein [Candidatus Babeliales bacterium]